jgi:hypothetical protein
MIKQPQLKEMNSKGYLSLDLLARCFFQTELRSQMRFECPGQK